MFMSLGSSPDLFVFQSDTLMPAKFSRTRSQKISRHKQHGKRDILQHNGPGADKLSLTGTIMHKHQRGNREALNLLNDLAEKGEQMLIMGGIPMGKWQIMSISEGHEYLNADATANIISFTINLERGG